MNSKVDNMMPEWAVFWRSSLLLCGALFMSAALIFFIAWNWGEMHRFARLAIVQAAVLLPALLAALKGPDSAVGRVALLGCGICIGPMLAVFGQTYQSGAQLWELFRVWAGFLFVLALVGRQAALWLTAFIVSSLFVLMYLGRNFSRPEEIFMLFTALPEYLLAEAAALAAWEGAAWLTRHRPEHDWLRVRWLPRFLAFALMSSLSFALFIRILDGPARSFILLLPMDSLWLLYIACMGGGWLWYRRHAPDLFMLACGVGSAACLLVALLLRARIFVSLDVFSLLAWGLIIVALTWGVGRILLRLQKDMAPANEAVKEAAVPWYVRAMLAFGGWVAAILILLALGALLALSFGMRGSDINGALLTGAAVLLVAARFFLALEGLFAVNFGFALALAGVSAASTALVMMGKSEIHWPFLAAMPLAATIFFIPNGAYHFLASAGLTGLFGLWLNLLVVYLPKGLPWLVLPLPSLLWWMSVVLFVIVRGRAGRVDPLALGALVGMAFFVLLSMGLAHYTMFFKGYLWPGSVGVAAGLGFMVLALDLIKKQAMQHSPDGINQRLPKRTALWAIVALAALAVPAGWFLPGCSIGLLGLGLGRRVGSRLLLGASGFMFFAYIIYFYYWLNVALVYKSLALAGCGLAMLVAAQTVAKFGILPEQSADGF